MQHATQLEAEADTLEQQASRFTLSPTQQQPVQQQQHQAQPLYIEPDSKLKC